MAAKDKPGKRLWDGITEDDFENEGNVEDKEMGQYNMEKMAIYALNATCSRHILDSIDSLKPVERRILYTMYLIKAYNHGNGTKKKSQSAVGETNKYHPHGGTTIYDTMIRMSQYWKCGIPLIRVHGSKGDPTIKKYAAERYTEVTLSKYAYECFFETFDPACVEMTTGANMEDPIPVSIPSKFPNVLLNGGLGIAYGYSFAIAPYNPDDVIKATKRLLADREDRNFYIYPDLPTGCDIIDDGSGLRSICETGKGKLHMRATIDILEDKNHWILRITSVPWLSSPLDIKEEIADLQKRGAVQIDEVRDYSDQYIQTDGTVVTVIKIDILLNRALDPYTTRSILYKNTGLDRTISIQFRMIEDGLYVVEKTLYESLISWIDNRREYLRRIYNKRIRYTEARISILKIFIELKDQKKIEKVMDIIRSNDDEDVVDYLVQEFGMNSYQANQVAEAKMRAWSKSKMGSYEEELPKQQALLAEYKEIARSEKKIDEIISRDLDDLKKYSHPRRSKIIAKEDGIAFSDSEHLLIFTKKGLVKKLPVDPVGRSKGYGQFATGDYPVMRLRIHNMDSAILFDNLGRYSVIPVSTIRNCIHSDFGESVFNVSKLSGEIISAYPFVSESDAKQLKKLTKAGAAVFTLTKNGQMKKTSISEFTGSRSVKNSRVIKGKDDDQLCMAEILVDNTNLLVYTKDGKASILSMADVPLLGKDSVGNIVIDMDGMDECCGFCAINGKVDEVLVVTEKGGIKIVPCNEPRFNSAIPMKRRTTTYLTKLQSGDAVKLCVPITKSMDRLVVWNRKDIHEYNINEIPRLSRRSLCAKLIPVPIGDNIIDVIGLEK